MTYSDLLKDPRWQKKRLKIFERDEWKCTDCGDSFSQLQIHHLYYKVTLEPWEYPDKALVTLCDLCHKKAEFIKWVIRQGSKHLNLIGFPISDIEDVKKLVTQKVSSNKHRESVTRYMDDIKKLMGHGEG